MRLMLIKSIYDKKIKYRMLNNYVKKGQTVFTGSSLMEFFPIDEMQLVLNSDRIIYNRGIAGLTTAEYLEAMNECIFELEPSEVFINIGSNDIGSASGEYKPEILLSNYGAIMERVKRTLPSCKVYVMAYYPVNSKDDFGLDKHQKKEMFMTRNNINIEQANRAIEILAMERGYYYIDVNKGLTDEDGELKKEYSMEGFHLWPNAYAVILENLKEYL